MIVLNRFNAVAICHSYLLLSLGNHHEGNANCLWSPATAKHSTTVPVWSVQHSRRRKSDQVKRTNGNCSVAPYEQMTQLDPCVSHGAPLTRRLELSRCLVQTGPTAKIYGLPQQHVLAPSHACYNKCAVRTQAPQTASWQLASASPCRVTPLERGWQLQV